MYFYCSHHSLSCSRFDAKSSDRSSQVDQFGWSNRAQPEQAYTARKNPSPADEASLRICSLPKVSWIYCDDEMGLLFPLEQNRTEHYKQLRMIFVHAGLIWFTARQITNLPYAPYLARHFSKSCWRLDFLTRIPKFGTNVAQWLIDKRVNFQPNILDRNGEIHFYMEALKKCCAQ